MADESFVSIISQTRPNKSSGKANGSLILDEKSSEAHSFRSTLDRSTSSRPSNQPIQKQVPSPEKKHQPALKEKKSAVANVWDRLYHNEQQQRLKYFESPRNLVVLLEQEKERCAEVESEYRIFVKEATREREKLVGEYQAKLQISRSEIDSLQKSLMAKTDEYGKLASRVEEERQRQDECVVMLRNDREKLIQENARVKQSLLDMERDYKLSKETITQTQDEKRRLEQTLSKAYKELEAATDKLKDKEAQWIQEKELRMQSEIHILQLQHSVCQREEDCKDLRAQLSCKIMENDSLANLRPNIEELKSQLKSTSLREQHLLEQVDKLTQIEKAQLAQIRDLELQEKKYYGEIQRLSQLQISHTAELESLRSQLRSSHAEVDQWIEKHNSKQARVEELTLSLEKATNESQQLQQQIQLIKHDSVLVASRITAMEEEAKANKEHSFDLNNRLRQEIALISDENSALRMQCEKIHGELKYSHSLINKLQSHIGAMEESERRSEQSSRQLVSELEEYKRKFQTLQKALREESNRSSLLKEQLQIEIREKDQQTNSQRAAHEKLEQLQKSLQESQRQLKQYQESERSLKAKSVEKERDLKNMESEITALQNQIKTLETEKKNARQKFNEQINSQQELASSTIRQRDNEIDQLRNQLQEKSHQYQSLKDQLSEMELQIGRLREEKIGLELERLKPISSQSAETARLQRELAMLQRELEAKKIENRKLKTEYQHAMQLITRLEDDLQNVRVMSSKRDSISEFKSEHVSALTKRLKDQVMRLALEKEQNQRSPSASTKLPAPEQIFSSAADDFLSADDNVSFQF